MTGYVEIVHGCENSCKDFMNRNISSDDVKLYKWEDGILYKKIENNISIVEIKKKKIEQFKLF